MIFRTQFPLFMLFKSFFRALTGHTHVETFQDTIKLGVGLPEFSVLGKNHLSQFDDIKLVHGLLSSYLKIQKTFQKYFRLNKIE